MTTNETKKGVSALYEQENAALTHFLHTAQNEINEFIKKIDSEKLYASAKLIEQAKKRHGRVHITGIGKPSHVAEYASALFSSTGTPCYFLDGTEAVHGSAGQVKAVDVVIAISNSGNTLELKNTVTALKRMQIKIIAVTGNPTSWLAKQADAVLDASVSQEGDQTNKPPRLSIVAEVVILQSLSILLQEKAHLSMSDYILWHPGGSLGAQTKKELEKS